MRFGKFVEKLLVSSKNLEEKNLRQIKIYTSKSKCAQVSIDHILGTRECKR